ncbi:hypothetical protein ACJMK2_040097 [Sinanodonta woodiana]|uniref:NACHT domain-containing protein n=1 Tax=Sinanodonta woodiana TaxID=1069815 RepID=A0ABD3WE04_SINWO
MPPTAAATKVKDPEYSNWLKVSLALYYLTVGLHTFIQGEVDAMHQFLLQKLYRGSGVPKFKCSSCTSKDIKQKRNTYVWKFKSSCPSHLCDIWLAELLTLHTNPTSNKIYWDNCDVTAWPFVPWECAKLYMPRGQLPANTGPAMSDSQALLTLMANCTYFHGKLSPAGLRLTHMVSKIRNSVMHSEDMRLSDGVSKTFIQDIISLLEDPTNLKSQEECKQAVNEIKQIVSDSIDVFFNVELEMIALRTAVNGVRQDMGKQEERTLGSVETLREEYIQLKEEMRTKIDAIENRQDTVVNDLESMENRIDCVENRVVLVEDRQDTVVNDLETMENRVDCVQNRIVTVENKQDTVVNDLESMENRVECVENRVVTVENRQDIVVNDLESMENRVDFVENRVVTVENRQNAMENKLDTIERDAESVKELVMEKTQQQQVELSQAIIASVEPLGVRVDAVEEKLKDLQESGHRTGEKIACIEGIKQLRDDLIKAYRNLRCVQVSPIFEKMRCYIDSIYVDIVIEEEEESRNLDEESKYDTQCKNTQTRSVKIINVTSYKQVFLDERGVKFKRVYLRGKGGLGKTTFCRKVLHAWCNAHENRVTSHGRFFQDEAVLRTFDLLFYLNLREVSKEETLMEVICTQFPLEEIPDKNVLGTLLKATGDKVLFILDGLDEMIVKATFLEKIVTRSVYPNCCFLVSSRPWKISQMELQEGTEIDLLLDLKGFSEENAIKYAKKIFKNCYNDKNSIEQFMMDIEGNKLAKQLIHVPLLLLILTQEWYENNRSLPCQLHKLYILFLNLLTDRVKDKYKKDPNHRQTRFTLGGMQSPLPTKISETSLVVNFGEGLFLSLCEVAHHFLLSSQKENSLVFEETKLLNVLGDNGKEKLKIALDLGVLSLTDSVSYICRKMNVSFLHKTFQEFFTALCFVVSQDKLANFVSSIADLNDVHQNENIIVFLVGLMPELGNSVLEKVNELCKDDWEMLKKEELMNQTTSNNTISRIFYLGPMLEKRPGNFRLIYISNIYLRCNDNIMGENVLLNVSGLVLMQDVFDPHPWNPAFLQSLILEGPIFSNSTDYSLVDLRGLTRLGYLRLEHLTSELYLPESGSLYIVIMMELTLSSCCCDELGRTLTQCTRLEKLAIHNTNLDKCLLDFSNMTELTVLDMLEVTLSNNCCDVLGSTLTHCTKLKRLSIHNTDLKNTVLDLSNMTELTDLDMLKVKLSSSCCDVLGSTLTHCSMLKRLSIHNTDLKNTVLDLSNMTELTDLDMLKVKLSSSCCDVLGSTLTHCSMLKRLSIHNTDLKNTVLDLSNMTELTVLDMFAVTLSCSCCDILGSTLTHCTKLNTLGVCFINLHNCILDLSNMTELTSLEMSLVTLSNNCCDELGSTLTHCTKLKKLSIHNTDLKNTVLDLSNMSELTDLDMSQVTLSSSCSNVIGSTLTHCTKLKKLSIQYTDLKNTVLDLSNMTELTVLDMLEVTLSIICSESLGSTLRHCTNLNELRICNTYLHNSRLDLSDMTDLRDLDISGLTLSRNCCDLFGSTLTHCTKLNTLTICNIDLHNCILDLSNMTELRSLIMSDVTMSSSCCDILGSTLIHCTNLKKLIIENTDLQNTVLDLSNMTELTHLDIRGATLSSNCCDSFGSTLTHCTMLNELRIYDTDLHNCVLDLSNMTDLKTLDIMGLILSSNCCDSLGSTMIHCTKLNRLRISSTDLHNCVLDLSNMTELRWLIMSLVTLSSNCCAVIGSTLMYCTNLKKLSIQYTDLQNTVLDLSNMTELTDLEISGSTPYSNFCYPFGSTLTHCTELKTLRIFNIDLKDTVLDLSNMTELIELEMLSAIMSSRCCDELGSTLSHCTKLKKLSIRSTDLQNTVLDLSNMTELMELEMLSAIMSSRCCDELGSTLSHCTKLKKLSIRSTDLQNTVLDLSNMTELTDLDIRRSTLSSNCCDSFGNTLSHCTELKTLRICSTNLHNCILDLSDMTELTSLEMLSVIISSSCCDALGRTLTHCTKLNALRICNTDLHNCILDLSDMTELTHFYMSEVTLSSSCCGVLGRTLTHCTKLNELVICNTDLHNCVLNLYNMTELTDLCITGSTLSSNCCDVLGSTLTHCTKLTVLRLVNTDLNNCMLDLSMTELHLLLLMGVTLSSSACQVLEQSLYQLKARQIHFIFYTYEKLSSGHDKWKVNFHDQHAVYMDPSIMLSAL